MSKIPNNIPDQYEPQLRAYIENQLRSMGWENTRAWMMGLLGGNAQLAEAVLEELYRQPAGSLAQLFTVTPLPSGPPVVRPPAVPGSRIKRAGLPYYWHLIPADELSAQLSACGLHSYYELQERTADPDHPIGDILSHMLTQIDKAGAYIANDRKLGIRGQWNYWNTNCKFRLTVDQHVMLFTRFADMYGTDGIDMLGFNETDSNTPEREAVDAIIRDRWPDSQTIAYGADQLPPWAAWTEHHIQHIGDVPRIHAPYTQAVTDSDILGQMMKDGVKGTHPNEDACLRALAAPLAAGCSATFYTFMKYVPFGLWQKFGAL